MYNIDAFNAIIAPPQAAILAVGRIADRVVAVNGQPVVRPMLTLTLSSDHRVVDGAQAALFLNDVAEAISMPANWLFRLVLLDALAKVVLNRPGLFRPTRSQTIPLASPLGS
jgi:hypothetical protein